MAFIAGVDFTGSNLSGANGLNLHSTSLQENQYFNAIQQVSSILLNFDSDKQVPLFGFGAVVDQRYYYSNVSHCFALNGNSFRPEVQDIGGIQDAYMNTINNVQYAGPTFFAPMLKKWNEMVSFECEKNTKKYYTFLILTDGMIHDINDTVEQVVVSSRLPVSIIIVGIGNANFSNMVFLDSDEQPLFCKNTQSFSKRDNVQFVKFNDINKNGDNFEALARETLKELPRQMIEYFEGVDIEPSDMGIPDPNLEVRDYSSYKAMELMSSPHFASEGNQDLVQKVLQEGIADPDTIEYSALNLSYVNNLKL
uniref:Copine C-terminal domain-containing protein n=1 Tax=Euplotes crassus TaxID=5936 RepID=A0A7S3KSE1_EUPCR|mmetsp:Transcript_6219/g.5802  ORF Transcript_6219/g.5802 Transcript_6219/m.5802 type:complete len:309 (+) Transcript_6219:232-1158(+)